MSVLRIPVRVMKTLNAPTVTVLTAVLVNKDSLETVQLVMVSEKVVATNYLSTHQGKRPSQFVKGTCIGQIVVGSNAISRPTPLHTINIPFNHLPLVRIALDFE